MLWGLSVIDILLEHLEHFGRVYGARAPYNRQDCDVADEVRKIVSVKSVPGKYGNVVPWM